MRYSRRMLKTEIPSAEEVKAALQDLTYAQMKELSRLSTVAFTTLWKVRGGETSKPGLETVRALLPHLAHAAAHGANKAAA